MSTKNAVSKADSDDPLDQEIDFSEGVQGFHAKRRKDAAMLILLEGELARQFKNRAEVLAALRAFLKNRRKSAPSKK